VTEVGMVKKAIAFGVTVMIVLTLSELPSAAAIYERGQRQQRVEDAKEEEEPPTRGPLPLPNAPGHSLEIAWHMSEVFDGFGGGKTWRVGGAALRGAGPCPWRLSATSLSY
jgi:hypothetical protein